MQNAAAEQRLLKLSIAVTIVVSAFGVLFGLLSGSMSILFDGVDIGRHAKIRRAIIDKGVHIPPGIEIGYDQELDRARGFTISEGGVTVIAKADGVEHFLEAEQLTAAQRNGG